MIQMGFSILFENKYIKELIEREFIKKHQNRILWPEKIDAHKALLGAIQSGRTSLPIYISSDSEICFSALQELDITSVIVLVGNRYPKNCKHYDLLISGVNSLAACQRAAEFIVNQLHNVNSTTCNLTILPRHSPSNHKSLA